MAGQYTAGVVRRMMEADARRGPTRSHAVPMATRAKTAPDTDAIPALPMSVAVSPSVSRMSGSSGGAAKVERKQQKKENHERWKALMCGLAKEKSQNSVALLSESTGIRNRGLDAAAPGSAPSTSIAAGFNSPSAMSPAGRPPACFSASPALALAP